MIVPSIKYSTTPITAILLRRYQRFLADVQLPDGTEVTVHCPNPGRMTSVCFPGGEVRLLATPGNKMPYRWIQTLTPFGWAAIDTMLPNRLLREVLSNGLIAGWGLPESVRPEVTVGDSRFDFELTYPAMRRLVEVKSVTWFDEASGKFLFPDAPSVRAVKHLNTLIQSQSETTKTAIVYAVQHPASGTVGAAAAIDPQYAETVAIAKQRGVEFRAMRLTADETGVTWADEELTIA